MTIDQENAILAKLKHLIDVMKDTDKIKGYAVEYKIPERRSSTNFDIYDVDDVIEFIKMMENARALRGKMPLVYEPILYIANEIWKQIKSVKYGI